MRIPRVRHRLNERVETINKSKMVEVMHELEPDRVKKLLREDYDRVTRAINGILNAYARDLPKGTHLRLRLNDCVTINLCWMAGKPGAFAPYPNTWISLSRQLRDRLRKLRAASYREWKVGALQNRTSGKNSKERQIDIEESIVSPSVHSDPPLFSRKRPSSTHTSGSADYAAIYGAQSDDKSPVNRAKQGIAGMYRHVSPRLDCLLEATGHARREDGDDERQDRANEDQ